MTQADRREVIEDLVKLRVPVEAAIMAIRRFEWDSDEELVVLGPSELKNALIHFLDGRFNAAMLEDWANAVEGRDDVRYDPKFMIDLIFEVANPELFQPLTTESVEDVLRRVP